MYGCDRESERNFCDRTYVAFMQSVLVHMYALMLQRPLGYLIIEYGDQSGEREVGSSKISCCAI